MSEVERIADQLRRAYEGPAWHGPALREILAGVTAEQAARRPISGAHTIWELVLHIAAWESIARRRLSGEVITDVPDEQDWPPVRDTSEAAWKKALDDLERGHQQLRQAVAALTDARLGQKAPGKQQDWSIYATVHGVVQHNLYHAGQIALLKKAFP
ncbi:MAG: DinB family protein [Terriglobia bacterium]